MVNNSKSKKAADSESGPTLDEVFQYEQSKRSALGGIAGAALGGDRFALAGFADLARVLVERAVTTESRPDWVELSEWLAYALSRMASGEEPNAAFGWSKKGKGRPSVRQSMDELRKRWMIGQNIAGMLASDPALSESEAQRRAGEAHHVSSETARNYWEQWQGKKPVK